MSMSKKKKTPPQHDGTTTAERPVALRHESHGERKAKNESADEQQKKPFSLRPMSISELARYYFPSFNSIYWRMKLMREVINNNSDLLRRLSKLGYKAEHKAKKQVIFSQRQICIIVQILGWPR